MYIIRVKQHFDAAHYLRGYDGDCARLHGHRWEVELVLKYEKLDDMGMAVDFKTIKQALRDILPDHKCLNEVYTFNPTAEHLARYLYEELKLEFDCHLQKVNIWESPGCYVEYHE
jgi:6-pyruvoyltetrahydropterin/6-carboxytetrahydropterin synthase